MTVYALLVGINRYDVRPLRGAVNDIEAVEHFLRSRAENRPVLRTLVDGQATRDAVVAGFREHLARAGRGDVALFWFAGHGSRTRVPEQFAHLEPSGEMQTLVCSDSRRRRPDGGLVPDLLDKEVSVLLDEVAAEGAHVVAVLDCCHAGGATRGQPGAALTVRALDPAPARTWPQPYLPGIDAALPSTPADHVLLAACEPSEEAREIRVGDQVRGVFTQALLNALRSHEPSATYRELLAGVRGRVQEQVTAQSPVVLPAGPGEADRPFLGGAVRRPAEFHLRWSSEEWRVDAGQCHGLPEPGPDGVPVLLVADQDGGGRRLAVRNVAAVEAVVDPVGWAPDPERVYPVVLGRVPVPRCGLVLAGTDSDEAALAQVRAAVLRAGPGGGPSPHVRVVEHDDPLPAERRLWVSAPVRNDLPVLRILRADSEPATPDVFGHGPTSAAELVRRAEHLARWEALRTLENPLSGLAGAVRIEVVAVDDGEPAAPSGRAPLRPDHAGVIRLEYRGGRAPRVVIRLRNLSDQMLWCTLLDLTDQHRVHDRLFPCAPIGPGSVGHALEGRPVEVRLPPGRTRGIGRDWLKLIVAQEHFTTVRFDMPALGEPAPRGAGDAGDTDTRDVDGVRRWEAGGDWTTAVLPIITTVPDPVGPPGS